MAVVAAVDTAAAAAATVEAAAMAAMAAMAAVDTAAAAAATVEAAATAAMAVVAAVDTAAAAAATVETAAMAAMAVVDTAAAAAATAATGVCTQSPLTLLPTFPQVHLVCRVRVALLNHQAIPVRPVAQAFRDSRVRKVRQQLSALQDRRHLRLKQPLPSTKRKVRTPQRTRQLGMNTPWVRNRVAMYQRAALAQNLSLPVKPVPLNA